MDAGSSTLGRRPAGRARATAALDAALDKPPDGLRWLVFEGPPGSGTSALLEAAAARAGERGMRHVRWTAGDRLPVIPDGAAPLVLCVDEAHRLDRATLDALPRPALAVAALRLGPVPVDPSALARVAADGATVVHRLEALDVDEVATRLGTDDEDLARACAELTGGNALHLARVAEHLAGAPPPDADALDDLVEPLLPWVARYWAARLAELEPAARSLAESLLVVSDGQPLWLAAGVAGLDGDDAAAAADTLAAVGLLASGDPVHRALPLAWRALEGDAPRGARRHAAQRRAAQLLARTADGAEEAARHLAATPPTGEAWAAEVLRNAARGAREDGRLEQAAAWLERALAEPLADDVRAELLVELADARRQDGRAPVEAAYREALRLAPPEARPRVHLLLGRALYGAGDYRAAALELDRALEIVDQEHPIAIELVAAYVAAARFDRTLEDAAARHLAPVLDRSGPGRTAAERALLAEISLEHGIRGAAREHVVGLALRAWADGLLLEGCDEHGISLSQVAAALTWSDAFEDSVRVLTATIERAERENTTLLGATARYLRAWPRYYLGRLAEAEDDVRAALASPGWEMYEPAARAILGHVLLERGDHAGARAALELSDVEAWRRTVPFAMLLETRSRLHAAAGDLEAAADDLAETGALLDTMGNRSPFCPWRSRLAVVTARQGDLARARSLVEAELDAAESIGTPRAIGTALHARGLISHLAGDDGLADLERSVSVLAGCKARVAHARALTTLGRAQAAAGRRRDARASLRDAVDLADAIGAHEIGEQALRELRSAGGRPTRRARGAPGGLTPSELRVARLAARGRTNRQIADELVVSTHTVRFHLGAAYRKLGISARTELADALGEVAPEAGT